MVKGTGEPETAPQGSHDHDVLETHGPGEGGAIHVDLLSIAAQRKRGAVRTQLPMINC